MSTSTTTPIPYTAEELDAFCRERLAPFKVPRIYEFRDSLPKSAIGQVLRRQLLEAERSAQKSG